MKLLLCRMVVVWAATLVPGGALLRGGRHEKSNNDYNQEKLTLLAHIDPRPGATIDMYLADDDDNSNHTLILLDARTDFAEHADMLLQAMDEADHDLVGFYTKWTMSNNNNVTAVPTELVRFAALTEKENGIELQSSSTSSSSSSSSSSDNNNNNNNARRLNFCAGACGCCTYCIGDRTSGAARYASHSFSHLQPYQWYVNHAIYRWNDNTNSWTIVKWAQVPAGTLSILDARTLDGTSASWYVATGESYGNGYHWRYC